MHDVFSLQVEMSYNKYMYRLKLAVIRFLAVCKRVPVCLV